MTDKLKDFEEDVRSLVRQYWGKGVFVVRVDKEDLTDFIITVFKNENKSRNRMG